MPKWAAPTAPCTSSNTLARKQTGTTSWRTSWRLSGARQRRCSSPLCEVKQGHCEYKALVSGSSAETSVHGGRCPTLTHDNTLARTGSLSCASWTSSDATVSLWLSPDDAACAAEPLAVTLQTCVAASTSPPSTRPGWGALTCGGAPSTA